MLAPCTCTRPAVTHLPGWQGPLTAVGAVLKNAGRWQAAARGTGVGADHIRPPLSPTHVGLAPVTILADALALGAAVPPPGSGRRGFEYGWVRGTGSAAFIGGTLLAGQAVSAWGLDVIVGLQALLLGAAAGAALAVPELRHAHPTEAVHAPASGVGRLLRLPRFRQLVLVAALVLGSHAMHDAFAVIRWRAAGLSPATVSVLWSASVAAEVLVFFVLGPALVT